MKDPVWRVADRKIATWRAPLILQACRLETRSIAPLPRPLLGQGEGTETKPDADFYAGRSIITSRGALRMTTLLVEPLTLFRKTPQSSFNIVSAGG